MASHGPLCPEEHHFIPPEELAQIRSDLANGDFSEAVAKVRKSLETIENAELHIAVAGVAGAGKSTFVNAIRGLGNENYDFVTTDVVQTNTEPKKYRHSQFKNVTIWDLPGTGAVDFKLDTYLKQVNFSRYDFFIIIYCDRFRWEDAQLANEIQKMSKNFYFVRSKIDEDMHANRHRSATFDERKIMQRIREDCISNLEKQGIKSVPVFLVSSFHPNQYEFASLVDSLEEDLTANKRQAFLVSIPKISLRILEKKKADLRKQIWKLAIVSCAFAAIPVPGLSIATDIAILVGAMIRSYYHFGIDNPSLRTLSSMCGKPLDYIKTDKQSWAISSNITVKRRTMFLWGASMFVKSVASVVPVAGSFIAGGISFATTYFVAYRILDDLTAYAQRVLVRALPETKKQKCPSAAFKEVIITDMHTSLYQA